MTATAVQVRCIESGVWAVQPEDREEPVSVHNTATEAERAARAHANESGCGPVVVYDRYARTRVAAV